VQVGDVVTVPVPGSDARVTHRVAGLSTEDGTTWATLRGDANQADDAARYPLAGTVLRAATSVPGLGRAVTGTPATVLAVGAAALVVIALLPGRGPDRSRRAGRPAPGSAPADGSGGIRAARPRGHAPGPRVDTAPHMLPLAARSGYAAPQPHPAPQPYPSRLSRAGSSRTTRRTSR
jgi:hypothetical protein